MDLSSSPSYTHTLFPTTLNPVWYAQIRKNAIGFLARKHSSYKFAYFQSYQLQIDPTTACFYLYFYGFCVRAVYMMDEHKISAAFFSLPLESIYK